jgi:hypothetical protein
LRAKAADMQGKSRHHVTAPSMRVAICANSALQREERKATRKIRQ